MAQLSDLASGKTMKMCSVMQARSAARWMAASMQLVEHDYEIFRELYALNFEALEEKLGAHCFS